MAAARRTIAAVLTLGAGAPSVQGASQQVAAAGAMNPIRKVVTLLQGMQKKVTAEGEVEKDLFERFSCYCKSGTGDLTAAVETAEAKMPQVTAQITASGESLEQVKADQKQAQYDRAAAKTAMAEATGIREKEAAAFASLKADADTNIAAIAKAVAALEKGVAGGFLQTSGAQVLRELVNSGKMDMVESDHQDLVAFLSQSSGYAPQSGQIIGILKQLGDTAAADLSESTKAEGAAIKSYEGLMAAKKKEVKALTATVEAKTTQIGELGVQLVQLKEDLDDTSKTYDEDKKFLQELEKSCANKAKEWEERSKVRAEELVALADTIKVLNDDDALDLFKKALPSAGASLLQVRASAEAQRAQALQALRGPRRSAKNALRPGLELVALALSGRRAATQGTFDKVIKMCDDMAKMLHDEQVDDDNKKEYCNGQFDTSDDNKKALERKVADLDAAIENAKESVETLVQEIAALEAGIKALDKSVAEATDQRKSENVEYKDLMASDSAAKEVLGFAKNRLNKFYNPKLFKAAPKQELTREERIFVNNGGTPPPTEAPGGIAGTGIAVLAEVSEHGRAASAAAPPAPPATWDAYSKKSEESNGVIGMIDLLIKDLTKEMTEAETGEKEAQADYEAMMSDAAEKRTADSKALAEKTGAKADLEADLQAHSDEHKGTVAELMAQEKYIASLHAECDWLIQNFETRKAARADEVDSLKRAKAVLSGADYSLLQVQAHGHLRATK